ncbi:PAS domain-containing sensor histidine kinase [Desertivirga arenae]|uniref:PAS domain-containing sensor histidine kinase n=1 Tax=Desertivirga arenae TaxID=2810309 RepID=UPI001A973B17|nr:ATP-binding protein [Pedobacter sp. SYSU D00823]
MIFSSETYQFLEAAPPCLILEANSPVYTILFANQEYYKATGTSESDLIGTPLFKAFPKNPNDTENDPVEALRKSLEECLCSKRKSHLPTQRYDIPIRGTNNFELKYWEASNTPILDSKGEVKYINHTVVDITGAFDLAKKERISFEVAEMKRISLYRLLMEAPAIICVYQGPDFIFDFVNPGFQQLFPERELLGKTFAEALPELVDQGFMEVMRGVYQTGQSFEGKELPVSLPEPDTMSFTQHYFDLVIQARYADSGKIDGIRFYAHHVTDRVKSRRLVEKSEERLKSMLNSLAQITWTTNQKGEIQFLNKKWMDYTGSNHSDSEGLSWSDIIHPDDYKDASKSLGNLLSEHKAGEFKCRLRRYDGAYRWHLNTLKPLDFVEDEEETWIGTATDIEMIMKMQKQKDEFVSTVSHELKTPVTSLKAYTQLLHREILKNENCGNKSYVQRMEAQINRLEILIRDLLDVSRIESGKLEFKEETFDISELITTIVRDLQLVSPSHQLIVQENPHLMVNADKNRISQVIINLVTNAVRYSPGGKKVNISLSRENNQLVVSIEDFGIGIPNDQKPFIFNRFHQAERSNAGAGLNLGLGLYICKEIIDRAGGKIWFHSVPNEGSIFYFSLPLSS